MCKCLFCYKELNGDEFNYHARCARKFFGSTTAPSMDYTQKDMDSLAEQIIRSQTTLTGVQPKLSLNLFSAYHFANADIVGFGRNFFEKLEGEADTY